MQDNREKILRDMIQSSREEVMSEIRSLRELILSQSAQSRREIAELGEKVYSRVEKVEDKQDKKLGEIWKKIGGNEKDIISMKSRVAFFSSFFGMIVSAVIGFVFKVFGDR